jgi:hypothetical protein
MASGTIVGETKWEGQRKAKIQIACRNPKKKKKKKKRRELVPLLVNCFLKVVFQIVGEFAQFFNLKIMMLTNKTEFSEKKRSKCFRF